MHLERLDKVAELRARFPEKDIEVDGGVGPNTVHQCAHAGSNVIVAGTAIFNAGSPEDVIKTLAALKEEGHFKYIGMSECKATTLRRAHAVSVMSSAMPTNIC